MDFAKRRLVGCSLASAAAAATAGDIISRMTQPAPRRLLPSAKTTAPALQPTTQVALAEAFAPETPHLTGKPTSQAPVRRAFVHNVHTGEILDAVYYEAGRYVPAALAAAMRVLRDWRNGQEHVMDPGLFDLLHTLGGKLGVSRPFQVVSAYRSKATNALMHERSPQVASKSQHILGKALDICLEGVDLSRLHRAALSLKAGGVGFYPQSGFVHVDVGPLREWVGT